MAEAAFSAASRSPGSRTHLFQGVGALSPDTGQAIGLQFHTHRQGIAFGAAGALAALHAPCRRCRAGSARGRLGVGDHVGLENSPGAWKALL